MIRYFETMEKYFEMMIAVFVLIGTVYISLHIILFIGRLLWNSIQL